MLCAAKGATAPFQVMLEWGAYASDDQFVHKSSGLTQKNACRISCTVESVFDLTANQGALLYDVKITQGFNVLEGNNL
jgi:hypothetical protein